MVGLCHLEKFYKQHSFSQIFSKIPSYHTPSWLILWDCRTNSLKLQKYVLQKNFLILKAPWTWIQGTWREFEKLQESAHACKSCCQGIAIQVVYKGSVCCLVCEVHTFYLKATSSSMCKTVGCVFGWGRGFSSESMETIKMNSQL